MYVDGQAAAEMTVEEAVDKIDPGKGLVWIDGEGLTADEITMLGERLGFNELILEDLQHANQRTKLEHYSDHFHVAVHDCELHDRDLVTREVDVIFGDGWLLSARQPPQHEKSDKFPIETVRRRFEAQRTQHDSLDEGFLIWALLDVVVDRYFVVTECVDDGIDQAEQLLFPEDVDKAPARGRPTLRPVFELSKALVEFRRAAAPLREVIAEMVRREVPCIGEGAILHLNNVYDHVLRVADLVESQRDIMTGLRDAELAVASNRMNENMQRLTSWGAILIVATLLTGVLGMNFRNAPNVDWEVGFAVIFGIMAGVGIPMYRFFKRKQWL